MGNATLRLTDRKGGAEELAREALDEGCEIIVAAGGDGTINEIINGMADDFQRARLGILPVGTANDFARSINIPNNLEGALEVLAAAHTMTVDVVRVTSDVSRHFINVSACGFSGQVDEKLTDEMKKTWGPLAYIRTSLDLLPDLTEYRTRIQFDDEEFDEVAAYNIVVANARYVGGGIPIAPQAQLDDGFFDVMILPSLTASQLAIVVPLILLGQHTESELLLFRRARKFSMDSRPGMWFNIDGELVGNEAAAYEIIPGALQVIAGT
jgi:diacylglycerol kinase (ATP)